MRRAGGPGRKRRRGGAALACVLGVAALSAAPATSFHASARCSACLSVVAELQALSEASAAGMALDLRSGVGAAKRGKVVKWRQSETRAYEVLDGLCVKMRGYLLVAPPDAPPGDMEFQRMGGYADGQVVVDRMRITGRTEIGSPRSSAKEHELELFCGALVEEHEEALVQALIRPPSATTMPNAGGRRGAATSTTRGEDAARAVVAAAMEQAAVAGGLARDICVAATSWCSDDTISQFVARRRRREAVPPPRPPLPRGGVHRGAARVGSGDALHAAGRPTQPLRRADL